MRYVHIQVVEHYKKTKNQFYFVIPCPYYTLTDVAKLSFTPLL